jgi:oligopeptide/dipeptide ABC transporter ATP-binding protein
MRLKATELNEIIIKIDFLIYYITLQQMLTVENIFVELKHRNHHNYILRNVSFTLNRGEILGIAGESGSGKTILSKTILGLIKPPIIKTQGKIKLNNKNLHHDSDFHSIRGNHISIILQNPISSLNPVVKIGKQLIETIEFHRNDLTRDQARKYAINLLKEVEIDYPEERLNNYPFNLSGGMNQRVMIALALACNSDILIADEPTTALDVSIQAQILNLIKNLQKKRNLSILFISHDISLLSKIADRIIILYAGEIMEYLAPPFNIENVKHPYTFSLFKCIPTLESYDNTLYTIPGAIIKNSPEMDNSCIFYPRCFNRIDICKIQKPELTNNYFCFNPLNPSIEH